MKKENKKTIIHEFDPCIYPRLLWVVKGGSYEDLCEKFDIDGFEIEDNGGAMTWGTCKKADHRLGALIWFPKASDIKRGDWIAHEAAHVALYIYHEIGASAEFENQEPFAYLVGWVYECVDKVRRMKNGENKGLVDKPKEEGC